MGIAFAPSNPIAPAGPGAIPPHLQEPLGSGALREATPWLLGGICAVAFAVGLWLTRGISPLNLDSPSYLYFEPSRTVGYPAFLWLVKALTGHAASAVPVQMAILAASLFWLGLSFHDAVDRPKLSLILQLLLVCSPDLWRLSAQLMTEALATAAVALWCAQLLRQLNRTTLHGHFALALIAAAGGLIRPSLLVLFAGTAIAALLLKERRIRHVALLSVVALAFAALLITPAACLLITGSAATASPLARGVLQHTLFCSQAPVLNDPDAAFVDQDSSAVRQYVQSAPKDIQTGLEHLYSAPLRFESIIPALGRLHHLNAGWQTGPIVARIARQRVEANPLCYGANVLRNYWDLVTQNSVHVGGTGRNVERFMAAHPPVPIRAEPPLPADQRALQNAAAELQVTPPMHPAGRFAAKTSPFLLLLGRLLFGVGAVIGLLSLFVLASGRRIGTGKEPYVVGLAAMGLVFHALFAATAVAELALIRYTIPAWPIVCTTLALALILLRNQPSATSSIFGTHSAHQMAPSAAIAAVR